MRGFHAQDLDTSIATSHDKTVGVNSNNFPHVPIRALGIVGSERIRLEHRKGAHSDRSWIVSSLRSDDRRHDHGDAEQRKALAALFRQKAPARIDCDTGTMPPPPSPCRMRNSSND
jgi:hypothetical protein